MWLINTQTHKLEEFTGRQIPPYAILSHTWGKEEVSFQDMKAPMFSIWQRATSRAGFVKILNTCRLAHQHKLQYAWVDTCCIDKSSSAELTEAINSMFKWYRRADICYAWLSDLDPSADIVSDFDGSGDLGKCRWFTRGWTLQELIAPREVEFYDRDWTLVGRKSELVRQLYAVTAIAIDVLRGDEGALWRTCVAEKMSWAAGRETTRVEDAAYCLMGIFGINMPLFYGEEERAFRRLQNEIMRESDDVTILAWERALHIPPPHQSFRDGERILGGVLAESADDFAVHRHQGKFYPPLVRPPPLHVMKNCVKIDTELVWEVSWNSGRQYYLCCGSRGEENVAIRLVKVVGGFFVRENLNDCVTTCLAAANYHNRREFSMLVNVFDYPVYPLSAGKWDLVSVRFSCPIDVKIVEALPWSKWHDEKMEFVAYPTKVCGSILLNVYHKVYSMDPLEIPPSTEIVLFFRPYAARNGELKGTLLERYGEFQAKVDHVNSFLKSEEPNVVVFDRLLTRIGLPMSNRVMFDVGTPNRSAVLSYTVKKCAGSWESWEVVFEMDELETASISPVEYQKW
ncbi:hypothetical protein COL516b_005317 [Colletotrichum fioriniae]|nr:uncharacterized protein COL516b_005317 [Colletotrichum fioriniae]KAJ0305620.1 hypothetical protein COL516b_005317 [Colletotrichum fioriniae]